MSLDDKLKEILEDWYPGTQYDEVIPMLKQAFAESGEWVHVNASQETQAAIANTMLGNKVMTGQEWYDRFEKELYKPPKQELPTHNDDGESHDRFFRNGGSNFMYGRAIEAAKKAAGLNLETKDTLAKH